MDFTKVLFGGAFIGAIISSWALIKSIAGKILGFFIRTVNLDSITSAEVVLIYLIRNHKSSSFYDMFVDTLSYYSKSRQRYDAVGIEQFKSSRLFWNGWIPFYFYINEETIKDNNGGPATYTANATKRKYQIFYFRGTIDILNIIKKAILYYNNLDNPANDIGLQYIPQPSKFRIAKVTSKSVSHEAQTDIYNFQKRSYNVFTHEILDLGFEVKKESLKNIILTEENQRQIESALLWKNNKQWYYKKNIPWRIGWLLWGEGGSGKSSLARAIAESLDIPLFIFKLQNMTSEDFETRWQELQASTPCVALIEDFDNIFEGRKNISYKDINLMRILDKSASKIGSDDEGMLLGLTFDTFLNCLDGVERFDGVFTIITTNCLDKIDTALLNRPGRIDRVIHLTYLTHENKLKMIDKILGDLPSSQEQMVRYVNENSNENLTPAQLQNHCIALALRELYAE